jgi:ankyrin repeat protein
MLRRTIIVTFVYVILRAVKCLLKLGASIYARDRFECTPLRNAIKFGHFSIVKIILAAGGHISKLENTEVINEIMTYIGLGDISRITMFVEAGADLNQAWIDGRTPLHMAAGENQYEIVRYLVDLAIKSYASQSLNLIRSLSEKKFETSHRFVANPIDLEPKDKYGKTPLGIFLFLTLDYALLNGDTGKNVYDILEKGIRKISM